MKKIITVLMALLLVISLVGCTKKDNNDTASTVGEKIKAEFLAEAKNSDDVAVIAEALANTNATDIQLAAMEVSEGFLNGFDNDITGFESGYVFSPMIGSIPFVGYVLKSQDPNALLESLKQNANPRWNICTEADETVYEVSGNLVFFLMCTNDQN